MIRWVVITKVWEKTQQWNLKALNVPALNEETATKLDALFSTLSGIKQYTITVDTQELDIVFDESQLSFRALISEMTEAGCPLKHIDAAVLL